MSSRLDALDELRHQENLWSDLTTLVLCQNAVRQVDQRDPSSPEELAKIPESHAFRRCLQASFADPLRIDPAQHPTELVRDDSAYLESPGSDEDIGGGDVEDSADEEEAVDEEVMADFYVRLFPVKSLEHLEELLDAVVDSKPQYLPNANVLLAYAATHVPAKTAFSVPYAGLTIANSPVGREEDDEEDVERGSFAKAFIEVYDGEVEIYRFTSLSFPVPSVIAARRDIRVDLFESLIIDSPGFVALNTAKPGLTLKLAFGDQQRQRYASIPADLGSDLVW